MAFALGVVAVVSALAGAVCGWLSPLGPFSPQGIIGGILAALALAAAFWAGRIS